MATLAHTQDYPVHNHDTCFCLEWLSKKYRTSQLFISLTSDQCRKSRKKTSLDPTIQQSHCQIPPSHAKARYLPFFPLPSSGFNWILRLLLCNVLSFNGPEDQFVTILHARLYPWGWAFTFTIQCFYLTYANLEVTLANSRRSMTTGLERLLSNSTVDWTNVVSSPLVSIFVSQSLRTGSISSCLPGVLVLLSLPPVLESWIMRRQDGNMLQARFLDFSTRHVRNVKL